MNKNIVYFNNFDSRTFSKHLKFLESNSYYLHKLSSLEALEVEINRSNPIVVIVTEDTNIKLVSSVTDIPILAILNGHINYPRLFETYKGIKNLLFLRAEQDHLDTTIETMKLIEGLV